MHVPRPHQRYSKKSFSFKKPKNVNYHYVLYISLSVQSGYPSLSSIMAKQNSRPAILNKLQPLIISATPAALRSATERLGWIFTSTQAACRVATLSAGGNLHGKRRLRWTCAFLVGYA